VHLLAWAPDVCVREVLAYLLALEAPVVCVFETAAFSCVRVNILLINSTRCASSIGWTAALACPISAALVRNRCHLRVLCHMSGLMYLCRCKLIAVGSVSCGMPCNDLVVWYQ
jgi:hypothetical protein